MSKSTQKHWDKVFLKTEESKLGWYEKESTQTLELLKQIPALDGLTIFIAGAGTSGLIESLVNKGARLILNDISDEAICRVKARLQDQSQEIRWLCQDISQPIENLTSSVDVWIDRAVLHFLLDDNDVKSYFESVKSALKIGGYILFAEFSKSGAKKCAGLKLHQYSHEELSENLGSSFKLISQFDYTYINPYGDPRPYIYALFKREE